MPPKLRYEFYLPTVYNDGSPIDAVKYRFVKNKVIEKYGAISIHPATISGTWVDTVTNKVFFDNCYRYEVVVDKNDENEFFFETLKKELKTLFNQHEIFMIHTEVTWVP